ncbi:MAG TPA: hypothetical protein VKY85_28955 [Candidatus Angelobacter sp.]|nr:hypothetical protein [Candidatus Angelobacter sp.]
MIRVYFVFEDSLDDSGVNLSFIDVSTQDPGKALQSVKDAAVSGELWKRLYPDGPDLDNPYLLLETKMMYLDVSALPQEHAGAIVLTT